MKSERYSIRAIAVVAALLCLLFSTALAEQLMFQGKPVINGTWQGEPAQYIAGEILVMFQDRHVAGADIARSIGGTMVRGVEDDGFAKIQVEATADIPALCEQLYQNPSVRFAEPNFLATIGVWNPNDPSFTNGTQWSLRNTGQNPPDGVPDADIDVDWAWDLNHGSSYVVLAILDSGIDMTIPGLVLNHVELDNNPTSRIILGPDYIGDGNGVADQNSHGTHVAGIAAAETNNSTGIAGMATNCKLLIIQVFDAAGNGTYEALRDGINYATNYQISNPSYRVVMNYSGGGGSASGIVLTALQTAESNDVPFVTISHNDGSSTCRYPCQYESDLNNLICVGSTDPWDVMATYSNYCNDVTVVAPGGFGGSLPWDADDIYSTIPPNTYAYKPGTSMAAPHVTGLCGLILASNSSLTALQVRDRLEQTSDDEVGPIATDPQGYDNRYGWGRVNAWSAVAHSYTTPYLQGNLRWSNMHTTAGQTKDYRLAPPPNGNWEIVATRPHTTLDLDCRWIDTDGSTILATSAYGSDEPDYVLAYNRPTSGSDYYGRIYTYSGTGKFSAEYQQASEVYIGSMYHADYEWESSHVVHIIQIYLQYDHRYTFKVDMASGEVDLGMSLHGPGIGSLIFRNRVTSYFDIDAAGVGGDEATSYTLTGSTGWYAFVIYNNNGRNGVMDISVEELLTPGTSATLSEASNVTVSDGYFYSYLNAGTSMGVMGVRPNTSNDYDIYLYNQSMYSYGGASLVGSTYGGTTEDFVLYNKATFPAGWYYPMVYEWANNPGNSGYVLDADDTDETLSMGTNGPFTFATDDVVRAWDVSLTNGVEYQFTGDITSGSLNMGIGLFRKDAMYKSRSQYFQYSYSGGAGVDESFSWVCDATTTYTLVAWNQSGVSGNYNILITSYPNLVTTVPTGWDYEFVPRNAGGALFNNCHITATLPGNTVGTNLNFTVRSGNANPVPAITYHSQLYLDGSSFFDLPWSGGENANSNHYFLNFTSVNSIRGGKHTVELRLDGTNTIAESNESDNSAFRQFVWSPYVMTKNVPVDRLPPPPYSGMFPRPNCDGFQFNRTPNYAYAVAITPRGSTDDYDLEGCDDYVGSLSGFDVWRVGSYMAGWYTDFFVATYTGVASTIYPDVYAFSGGTGNYVIEATDSYNRILTPTDNTIRDTLATDHNIRVYEAYLIEDSTYVITLDNISGSANLDLSLYGPEYGYRGATQYAAASWTGSSDEQIVYTATAGAGPGTAWYVITVHKSAYAALPLTNVYDLTIEFGRPNLVTTIPTGWDFEFVPRNAAGAGVGDCHITATLPGNTTNTYLNFSALNNGFVAVPPVTFYDQLYLDGSSFFDRPWSTGLSVGNTLYHLNWTNTTPIRGGKHTVELRLDGTDIIDETNELDNTVPRQFIWSPLQLTNGTPVFRAPPPPLSTMWTQPNCDGFKYIRTGSYAYGVGICPFSSLDYDLRLYDDYTGSLVGFDSLRVGSYWISGFTDFVVATFSNVAGTVYPGVYDFLGTGNNEYVIEAIDANGKILSPESDNTMRDTLASYQILNVYEAYMMSGFPYEIELDNISGTADLALAIYGPNYGYYSRAEYVAYSNNVGPDELINYTPATGSYHVIVVFKPSYDQLAPQNIYDLRVTLNQRNLTYSTPAGWSYPIVPRNVGGATPNNCTVTASLPGNTANTFYNISSYNAGPGPVLKQYYDYIFIDSVWYYGAVQSPPILPTEFGLRQNIQSLANPVRGGRHTMGVYIDYRDSIPETNETDNWYARQFVWTPYILSDYTPVTRSALPQYGSGTYPNCDGFEYTTGYWGAVGILPFNAGDDFNLRLHQPWVNSETGFDLTEAGSGWGLGQNDFVLANDIYAGERTMDVGVVKDFSNPGIGQFVIQQANEQITFYSYGTYGPYTIGNGSVMGVWEVHAPSGSYDFMVDVVAGNADIGTSLYDGSDTYFSKSEYFPGGFSNSAGAGGDESFTIASPYIAQFFGWAVWKNGSADRTLTSTFYLTWGPSTAPVPRAVDDLVIVRIDYTNDVQLVWSQVTQDTSGNPLEVDYYRVHRNVDPDFEPSPSDSIGFTTPPDTTYDDLGVTLSNLMYFYKVIAVDTDGVVVGQPTAPQNPRIVTGTPPRDDAPAAVRSRSQH